MINQLLGELEEKIMKIIWNSERELKPSEVQVLLDKKYAYTTVMTVMSRLFEKKLLKRRQKGKAFFYYASRKKDSFLKPKLSNLFKNILESYGDLAINQFIDSLDEAEIKKIKDKLNERQ